jgi:hypothetical protein
MSDLRAALHTDQMEQSEFEQILLSHFGSAQGSIDELSYARQGAPPALVITYDKNDRISKIETRDGLLVEDLEQIAQKVESELRAKSEPAIGQRVLFSAQPLNGYFRYKDLLQFVPMPADAPRASFAVGAHPLLMQYKFAGSNDWMIKVHRSGRRGRELALVCAPLVYALHDESGTATAHHWSLVGSLDNPPNLRSEYCQEGYTWTGANGLAAAYIDVSSLHPAPRLPENEYYTQRGVSVSGPQALSASFEASLDSYFSLSESDRNAYLRGCHWFNFAQRTYSYSNSGAYGAMVNAIEALMNSPISLAKRPKSLHCTGCQREVGQGPTKLFEQFVDQHATGVPKEMRKRLYEVRSALAHGRRLLHSDRYDRTFISTGNNADSNFQRVLWLIVRVVFVNWLEGSAKDSSRSLA